MMKDSPWKLNLVLLWLSQLMVMTGFSAMQPFVSLFLENELGLAGGRLAFYVSLYSALGMLGYFIFTPLWGILGDRYGTKLMLLRGTFLTCLVFPLMGYVSHPASLVVLRFITACCAGTTNASQIMVARYTPEHRQGFAQGVLSTAIWGGTMLGNVVGGIVIHYYDFKFAFWLCGILYLVAGLCIIFTKDTMKPRTEAVAAVSWRPHLPRFAVVSWILFGLFFLLGYDRNLDIPYIALKVETITGKVESAYWTGIVSAYVALGAVFSGVAIGYLADKLSPRRLLAPIMLISALALAWHGFARGLVALTFARVLLYLASGGIQPVLQKMLSATTPASERGSVFGTAASSQSLGAVAASLVGGWIFYKWHVQGIFAVSSACFLLTIPIYHLAVGKVMKRAAKG